MNAWNAKEADLNLSRPLTGAHTFLQKMTDTHATMPQVIIEKTMLFYAILAL
jgi:hypothetical protein